MPREARERLRWGARMRRIGLGCCFLGLLLLLNGMTVYAASVSIPLQLGDFQSSPSPGLTPTANGSFTNLEPGDTVTRTVYLLNPLSTAQYVTLTSTSVNLGPNVVCTQGSAPGIPCYGLFGGPTPATVQMPQFGGTLQPGQEVPVTVAVNLPLAMNNSYKGAQGQVDLVVTYSVTPPPPNNGCSGPLCNSVSVCTGACGGGGGGGHPGCLYPFTACSLPIPTPPPSNPTPPPTNVTPPPPSNTTPPPGTSNIKLPIPAPAPPLVVTPPGRLPKTGQSWWVLPLGVLLLVVGLGLSLLGNRPRRRSRRGI